jgi:transcription elongation factor GreA-like protein
MKKNIDKKNSADKNIKDKYVVKPKNIDFEKKHNIKFKKKKNFFCLFNIFASSKSILCALCFFNVLFSCLAVKY